MSKSKRAVCVYCAIMADVTRDHVPPRNLFPDPPPPNLITVPACSSCNTGSSTHDEYLRAALALRHDLSSNPAVVAIRQKVQRALAMPEKKGLKNSIHGTLRNVVLLSPSGRQLGTQQTYDVNLDRLLRVVARTTAGLFWKFQQRCIPSGYVVGAQLESELNFSGAPETAAQIGVLRKL